MITAVQTCGCAPKYSGPSSSFSPPCTPLSMNSAAFSPSQITAASNCSSKISNRPNTGSRQPFENPRQKSTHEDEAKCPCPRPGHRNYNSMLGKCSPCCAGVFPENKIVSKIVEEGKPYKEIEAIINDNKMVIRIQRESVKSEWDPPCDCVEGNLGDDKRVGGRLGGGGCGGGVPSGCGNNVVFQKVDNSDGCHSSREEKSCRTVTVFPEPENTASEIREAVIDNEKKEKKEKSDKSEITKLIDLEENPNIFVLRIRKRSENSERKNNIDLEFRTPRPWINRPKPKPDLPPPKPPTPKENKVKKKPAKGKGKGAGKKKKGKK